MDPKDAIRQLGDRANGAVKRALNDAGAFHVATMGKDQFGPYRGQSYSNMLQSRSGATRRAIGFETRGSTIADLEMRTFVAGVPWAHAQEYGARIRPRRRRYLTIPLRDALTASGALKGGARLVQRGDKWMTADGLPTFIFGRTKKYIGARDRSGRTRLLYRLKEEVDIPARLGFRKTFREKTLPYLNARLAQEAAAL